MRKHVSKLAIYLACSVGLACLLGLGMLLYWQWQIHATIDAFLWRGGLPSESEMFLLKSHPTIALRALGSVCADDDALSYDWIDDNRRTKRIQAAYALVRIGGDSLYSAAGPLLEHDDPRVRSAMATQLIALLNDDLLPGVTVEMEPLIKIAVKMGNTDPDPKVRMLVIKELACLLKSDLFSAPWSRLVVRKAMADNSRPVRQWAISAIADQGVVCGFDLFAPLTPMDRSSYIRALECEIVSSESVDFTAAAQSVSRELHINIVGAQ